MILQIGSFFGSLVSGIGTGLGGILRAAAPAALGIGQQFLQRELDRKFRRRQTQQIGVQTVQALNTPGIAVARLGGTIQPVGGRVQRGTFQPAALTTAQNPIGNIPLLPVGGGAFQHILQGARQAAGPSMGLGFPAPQFGGKLHTPPVSPLIGGGRMPNGALNGLVGPRFATDEMGKTINFVPSPRGEGFISVQQARALGLSAMKPWWRFNRMEGQFEKIKRRRMNPFNFKAAKRAGRRIESTLDAIKGVVTIQRKLEKGVSAGGKVVKFRTGKRKKARA